MANCLAWPCCGCGCPSRHREIGSVPVCSIDVTAASLDAAAGRRSRYCQRTRLPGCKSPLARNAAWLISTRGPKPIPPASLSGSLVSAARSSITALPMVMRSPGLRSRRANKAGSAAAPKASPCWRRAPRAARGSVAAVPNSG